MYVTTAMKHDAKVTVEYVKAEDSEYSFISMQMRDSDTNGMQVSMNKEQAHDLLAKLTEALKHD